MIPVIEIAFGLIILVLIVLAFYNRRKQNKTWLKEERYEESGDWIDKRAGERGAYGSLDAIREAERHGLSRQSRIADAALDIRNYAFEHIPGFHERSDEQVRDFTAAARARVSQLFDSIDKMKNGQTPATPDTAAAGNAHAAALKKIMLDAAYVQFPWLLDQEIETLKQLDKIAENLAAALR